MNLNNIYKDLDNKFTESRFVYECGKQVLYDSALISLFGNEISFPLLDFFSGLPKEPFIK